MLTLFLCLLAWQNYANYQIEVTLNDSLNMLFGRERIRYMNLSPDTLNEVFLLLYPNAFRKGSAFFREIEEKFGEYKYRYLPEEEYGWMEIDSVFIDGEEYKERSENVSLEIPLKAPLPPGQELDLELAFRVKIPRLISRLGYQGKHYEISQWYPKMGVYDSSGWHHDDYHVWGEFYGDFGTYDVKITLPRNYIVGASGRLIEPFEYQRLIDSLSLIPPEDFPRSRKEDKSPHTLRYLAHRVHDFAWVADPSYIPSKTNYEEVEVTILALPKDRHDFSALKDEIPKILKKFEEWYGPYPYAQLTIADSYLGQGRGMEYPQLVLVKAEGTRIPIPSFKNLRRIWLIDVLSHETAHQWFYGVLANNEIDEPWLDEGFATFSEERYMRWRFPRDSLREILGPLSFFGFDRFGIPALMDLGLIFTLNSPWNEPIVGKKAFQMQSYSSLVYAKGRRVLQMLGLVVGDEKRDEILRKFYHDFAFHHPTTKDFERVSEEVPGKDLGWFFDDWLRTSKESDFKIGAVKRDARGIRVEVVQKGEIEMPVGIAVREGDSLHLRMLERGERVLFFEGVKKKDEVIIDPKDRIPEPDEWNNVSPRRIRVRPLFDFPQLDSYQIGVVPLLFHNGIEKFKVSLFAYGHQATIRHFSLGGVGFRSGDRRLFGVLSIKEPFFEGKGNIGARISEWGGLTRFKAWFLRSFRKSPYSPDRLKLSLSICYEKIWDLFSFDSLFYQEKSEAFFTTGFDGRGANPLFRWKAKMRGTVSTLGYLKGSLSLFLRAFKRPNPEFSLYFGKVGRKAPVHRKEFMEGDPFLPVLLMPFLAHKGRFSPLGKGLTLGEGVYSRSGLGEYGDARVIATFRLPLKDFFLVFVQGGWLKRPKKWIFHWDAGASLGFESFNLVFPILSDAKKRFKFGAVLSINPL